jgi:ribonuclease BN (tRNA processing enzyme)
MLSRFWSESQDWKRRTKGVWISHAHLDHYGGIPCLIRVLHQERMRSFLLSKQMGERPLKRRRQDQVFPVLSAPWVMAPVRVLRYLNIMLGCRNGLRMRDSGIDTHGLDQLFVPRVHNDPTFAAIAPPGPWSYFENLKVNHSCCPSYGLLIGWWNVDRGMDQFLCYSGDTRPCLGLIHACRRALRRKMTSSPRHANSLTLIHEATFEDADSDNAQKKRHSTIGEAIRVASDIPASKVLLTHFSQRYISLQHASSKHSSTGNAAPPVGLATDGLWLPIS